MGMNGFRVSGLGSVWFGDWGFAVEGPVDDKDRVVRVGRAALREPFRHSPVNKVRPYIILEREVPRVWPFDDQGPVG